MTIDDDDSNRPLAAVGFEKALLGYAWLKQLGDATVAVYDRNKCIDILIERDGMSYEEAVEFFDFNVEGAFVGEHTPVYVYPEATFL